MSSPWFVWSWSAGEPAARTGLTDVGRTYYDYCARIVGEVEDAERAVSKGLAPWQLRRVTEFFEANFTEDISLKELADLVGLSQSQFARAFKASTGAPPHRWVITARIKRAQELLLQGTVSLADVSARTGFADQSHFTKVFRRVTGTSPGHWRRSRRF